MQRQRAFSIIESLIAMVLLIGVILALLGIVPTSLRDASRDSQRVEATTAAQQYLDSLRQYVQNFGTNTNLPPAPSLAVDAGDTYAIPNTPITSPGNFMLANNGCPFVSFSSRMYDCSVTVTWTDAGENRSVSVESYVTAQN
jgi:type II secretory pathway pseudopilin PulG